MIPMNRLVAFPVLVLLAAGACGNDEPMTPIERWFSTTRTLTEQHQPDSDVMQIDPNSDCELVSEVTVAGKPLELFGAATALFGQVGSRYQCAWSGDSNASANVRLEVITIDDYEDFADYKNLIPTRDGNTVVATDIGNVQVAVVSARPRHAVTHDLSPDRRQRTGRHPPRCRDPRPLPELHATRPRPAPDRHRQREVAPELVSTAEPATERSRARSGRLPERRGADTERFRAPVHGVVLIAPAAFEVMIVVVGMDGSTQRIGRPEGRPIQLVFPSE